MAGDHASGKQLHFFRRHRWLTGFGIGLIILLLCMIFLLPPAIRWGIEKWLESHGRLKAEVQDVDFNLFTGNLVIHSLMTQRKGEGGLRSLRAAVELTLIPVFKKRLLLDDLDLRDTTVDVTREENGDLYVGGLRISTDERQQKKVSGEQKSGWEIGFGGIDLKNVTIVYSAPGSSRQLTITQGHIDPLQSWNPASAGDFSLSISIDDGSVVLAGSIKPYARKSELHAEVNMRDISLAWFRPWIAIGDVDLDQGKLTARTSISVSSEESVKADLDGTVTLHHVSGTLAQNALGPVNLTWNGSLEVAVPAASGGFPQFDAQGKLTAESPHVQLKSPGIKLSAEALTIEGEFSRKPEKGTDSAAFHFNGKTNLDKLQVRPGDRNDPLAAVDRISVTSLTVKGLQQMNAESAQVRGTKFYAGSDEKAEKGLALGELTFQDIRVDSVEKILKFGTVSLLNVEGEVIRNQKGAVKMIDRWPDMTTENEQSAPKETGATAWRYVVDAAQIGGDSAVVFRDDSVDPPVDIRFTQIEGQVKKLDSRTSERSPVDLKMELNESARIEAEGGITPLTSAINMDVKGKVERFSLPVIRGYARQKMGYTIRSGLLYADFHLQVNNNRSDSLIKLFITDLDLKRLDPNKLDEFNDQLGMPLNAALDLLRDGDRNIRLALPITGKVSRPKVEFGSVIAKAVEKAALEAIKTAALSYFAPLGAAYVAGKLIGKAMALRLDAIDFEAGQANLDENDRKYLGQVAEKIAARPKVNLLLCGKAVPADRHALAPDADKGKNEETQTSLKDKPSVDVAEAELLDLAEKRAEAAHRYLASKGIASKRFIPCAPEIIEKDEVRPKVELGVR